MWKTLTDFLGSRFVDLPLSLCDDEKTQYLEIVFRLKALAHAMSREQDLTETIVWGVVRELHACGRDGDE